MVKNPPLMEGVKSAHFWADFQRTCGENLPEHTSILRYFRSSVNPPLFLKPELPLPPTYLPLKTCPYEAKRQNLPGRFSMMVESDLIRVAVHGRHGTAGLTRESSRLLGCGCDDEQI